MYLSWSHCIELLVIIYDQSIRYAKLSDAIVPNELTNVILGDEMSMNCFNLLGEVINSNYGTLIVFLVTIVCQHFVSPICIIVEAYIWWRAHEEEDECCLWIIGISPTSWWDKWHHSTCIAKKILVGRHYGRVTEPRYGYHLLLHESLHDHVIYGGRHLRYKVNFQYMQALINM